jgi:hypothetical protein
VRKLVGAERRTAPHRSAKKGAKRPKPVKSRGKGRKRR